MALMVWTPEAVIDAEACWQMPHEKLLRRVYSDMVKSAGSKDILEVGCGTGMVYRAFRTNGITVPYTGLDISPAMLKRCKAQSPDCSVILGTADELPFADETFDSVLAFEVFCHLDDFTQPLKEMIRVSKNVVGFSLDLTPTETTLKDIEAPIVGANPSGAVSYPRVYWSCADAWNTICKVGKNEVFHPVEIRTISENKWVYLIRTSQVVEKPTFTIRPWFGYTTTIINQYSALAYNFSKIMKDMKDLILPHTVA